MTISSSEIRRNMTVLLDGEVHQILEWQHRQAPKAPPTLTLKVRHLVTGNVFERKLPGTHKLTQAPTESRSCQYLYADGELHNFMDNETFDQFAVSDTLVKDALPYITEGSSINFRFYEGLPIITEMPSAVVLEVASAEPGLRGDTQSGATKPAVTDTGLTLQVPLFIDVGDKIKVNTSSGEYLGRAD